MWSGASRNDLLTWLLFSSKERQKRQVTHFQFLSWPDYGVPSSAASLIDFLRVVRNQQRLAVSSMGVRAKGQCPEPPIVVHCSAGIGRTGNAPDVGAALGASRGNKGGGKTTTLLVASLREFDPLAVNCHEKFPFNGLLASLAPAVRARMYTPEASLLGVGTSHQYDYLPTPSLSSGLLLPSHPPP